MYVRQIIHDHTTHANTTRRRASVRQNVVYTN